MTAVKAEFLADCGDFSQEQFRAPHRDLVRLADRRIATAELVVTDNAAAVGGEFLVRLHVVPCRAWPAMQAEQRELAGGLGLARDPIPGPVTGKGQITLSGEQSMTHVDLR